VGKYIIRRLLQMIPVFLGATLLLYWLNFALPGDPTAGRCGERPCSPAYIEGFNAKYGLDKPFIVQYVRYLTMLLHGDLGTNYYNNTVVHELAIRYPTTIRLAMIALAFMILVGVTAGIIAGLRKGGIVDNIVTIVTLLLISMPVFVIGGLAQRYLGLQWKIFPVTAGNPATWYQLIMPGLVLAALSLAYVARLTRTSLVENLRADYVRTAKAKGLSSARSIGLHALRNSLLPVITFIGASVGGLMGGAIVTERIFNINGIGSLIWRSINQRDGMTLVGTVVVLVMIYLVVNLLVDLLYGVLDPRISHD